ncbi:MAG: translation initiation factor IF-2 [Chloroflexi bacterium]|nr:translation initiation factor IF-2 [Chloroflexota bacterium]MDA1146396.1 translation initiation factor IF-2 [Chloroflexota bacterium]MQC82266.1 translation initiation factor IF-2 [Chloroflexota bacterium]MQC82675.1 translation initiation factor IF-2 [Chloroflexota bacterium]PKB56493.1 MAG: translation initiation factor IF-2 [SAR202 cluster bacterium Casp-Chloro-G1]
MTQPTTTVRLPQAIVVGDLATALNVTAVDVIKELMKNGVMATINQVVDFDTAAVVAADLGFEPEEEDREPTASEIAAEAGVERPSTSMRLVEDDDPNLVPRPPIVTVLGHVDHGKTTLLDTIRRAKVVDSEAGGITQHIGAYQATAPDGRLITFIDTPGHEAFSQMRARGAQVTDVAIIVIAADDGLMPQSREAIDHVRAAGVPMVVAINKIDAPNADIDRARTQLTEIGLVPEDFGGDQVVVPISALKATGIDELLESVLLVSDLDQPKANPQRDAIGIVLESASDRQRGVVATLLVQSGTLRQGDAIICGLTSGRIRAMTDHEGNRIKEAGPATPVEVMGLNDVPPAGERFEVRASDKVAKREAEDRQRELVASGAEREMVTLDSLFGEIHKGNVKDMNIVLKADVQGSLEPLVDTLDDLSVDEVKTKVIHASVGSINESDVQLAVASKGVIIGFNVEPETGAKRLADQEGVEIRLYSIIYDIIQDVEKAVQGMLEPIYEERQDALIEVRQIFRLGRRNAIAGSYVRDGTVLRSSRARVMRGGEMIFEGPFSSLKRFDDDVREVATGLECGIQIDGFTDFQEGDEIVAFRMERTR